MNRPLLLFVSLAACNVGHMVGQNQNHQNAVTCAAMLCGGTTVCVDSACVEPTGTCGGIAGLQCPNSERCVDDPRDNCDPTNGGADCGGVCVPAPSANDAGSDAGTPPLSDGGTKPMECGGHRPNPPMCPSGYTCVDDPNSCSMAVDCPGICVKDPDVLRWCGGLTANPYNCEVGKVCVDHPYRASMAVDHPGICIKKTFCGGIAGIQCPGTLQCVDDPSDNCDPNNGGADCGGYCVFTKSMGMCGGFAGFQCASALRCVDDLDDCDPTDGGADCSGLCVP